MSNAGYGNHDAAPPGGSDGVGTEGASAPKPKAKPDATSHEDPSKTPGAGTLPSSDGAGDDADPAAG